MPVPNAHILRDRVQCSERFPGCQERDIVCENYHLSDPHWPGDEVNDSICEELGLIKPHAVRSCSGGVCNVGVWLTDPVSRLFACIFSHNHLLCPLLGNIVLI